MPIIRKLTTVGAARGISLPKSWIDEIERRTGQKITEVALEVNGSIVISPVVSNKTIAEKKEA